MLPTFFCLFFTLLMESKEYRALFDVRVLRACNLQAANDESMQTNARRKKTAIYFRSNCDAFGEYDECLA